MKLTAALLLVAGIDWMGDSQAGSRRVGREGWFKERESEGRTGGYSGNDRLEYQ